LSILSKISNTRVSHRPVSVLLLTGFSLLIALPVHAQEEQKSPWVFTADGGGAHKQEFRLDNNGVAPGGVGRDQSVPFVFSGVLSLNEKISFSIFGGIQFGGNLKLKDTNGDLIEETDYDPAAVFGATFQIQF